MSLMLNATNLAGNLVADPEIKYLTNGQTVATFTLAHNRRYTTGTGEKAEETTFIEVEVWAKQAENCKQHLSKGRNCLVEGMLKQSKWTDKNGNPRSKIILKANRVHFLGAPKQQGPQQ